MSISLSKHLSEKRVPSSGQIFSGIYGSEIDEREMETVTGRQMEETPLQGGGSERLRGPCGASDWERSQPALGDRVEDAWNVTVTFVVMPKSESASAHQRVSQSC